MILVTGGTGFVGRGLVPALLARGLSVRILTRDVGHAAGRPPGVDVRIGDLLDAPALERALAGVTAVVHLAGLHAPAGSAELTSVNVTGTERLAAAARQHGVRRFVHVSSAAVYGMGDGRGPAHEASAPHPVSAYGRSKLEGERVLTRVLEGSRTSWIVLRPTGIIGAGRPAACRVGRLVRRRRLWIHVGPPPILHPVPLVDVVWCLTAALEQEGVEAVVLNVAGERALAHAEFLAMTSRAVGGGLRQAQAPVALSRPAARLATACLRGVGLEPPLRLARLAWRSDNRALDTARAERLLGFHPSPLRRAVEEAAEWCRREGLL